MPNAQRFIPFRVLGIALCFVSIPMAVHATPVATTDPALPDAIAEVVSPIADDLVERGVSVGLVVGVLLGDETRALGYGARSRVDATPPDGTTLYEIASITKNFTAMLVFDAVERGDLALDDPVEMHLPAGLRVPAGKQEITIRHLIDHKSGLPRNAPSLEGRGDTQARWKAYDVNALKRDLAQTRLRFEPGAEMFYSNYGAGVLGLALCTATDLEYDVLLRRRMTGPLGMSNTWQTLPASEWSRLAPGYDSSGARQAPLQLDALKGSGGMISSVDDMLTFLRAIIEVDPRIAAGTGFFWHAAGTDPKLGWAKFPDNARTGAAGRSWGYKSSYVLYPRRRMGVVVLSNTESFEIDQAVDDMARALLPLAASSTGVRAEADPP